MKPPLFIAWHLGLGDLLIYNALTREKAAEHEEVIIPCWFPNLGSLEFMFRDLPNVRAVAVDSDHDMLSKANSFPYETLRLGMWGTNFKFADWDKVMYEQAGLPFELRWDRFKVVREPKSEVMSRAGHIFIHHDPRRGFTIPLERLPLNPRNFYPWMTKTIFDWCGVIEGAAEIHCIDSSFAILCDSIPTVASRLVLHLYARPEAKPPNYRKNWEILTA